MFWQTPHVSHSEAEVLISISQAVSVQYQAPGLTQSAIYLLRQVCFIL